MSTGGGAKVRGIILQFRSSLIHKTKIIKDQPKELTGLKVHLKNSKEMQSVCQLEDTCVTSSKKTRSYDSKRNDCKKSWPSPKTHGKQKNRKQ